MKRHGAICQIAALICVAPAFSTPASGASEDYFALMKLITENEDVHMDALDLAFFLATHNFEATPMDGYVVVKLEGTIYSLTPNGEKPGLADVTIIGNARKEECLPRTR
jgi:hypothetical protein